MSTIQPTPDAIEKLFLKSTLTPLVESEAPTYTSLTLLQDELISNAVSVYSALGDGETGHLFLVVSDEQYATATKDAITGIGLPKPTPPTPPTAPPVPVLATRTIGTGTSTRSTTTAGIPSTDPTAALAEATTAAAVSAAATESSKIAYKLFLDSKHDFLLYHNTSKCLVKQIVRAVPKIYIEELEDPITKFGKLLPYTLLNHLFNKYGKVSDLDLDANQDRMKAQWMPPMPIEALFRQLRAGKQFAKHTGEEIPDSVICHSGYNNLFATGLFTQPCYEWRMLKPDSVKTWDKFQTHFTLAANDRKM